MAMTSVIVEDELVAAQNLRRLIGQIAADIEVIAVLQSVEESIDWFSRNQAPDLVFMDIHLSDGSSFSIFDKATIGCPIIFTTAYDEYALKAFEVNSIDYLLKPINSKNLERAIAKFGALSQSRTPDPGALAGLLASFRQPKEVYKSNFLIPYKDKLIPVATNKIACIYTESKTVHLITLDQQEYKLDKTLDELYAQLDPDQFFRANRQYIVAHKAIKDISVWFGSKLSINLNVVVPEKIIVSKAHVGDFKMWFTQ